MRSSREHSKNCEQATRPKCVCSTCGGSHHGWVGHLGRARAGEEGVRALREPAEKTWWEQERRFQENGRRTPTTYLRQAGGGVAVAGLVSWLAEDTARIDRVERLGRLLNEEVFDQKLREFASEQAEKDPAFGEYGRTMAGHFWCDLLVEIANALDQGAELQERIPTKVRDAVLEHDDASAWGPVRKSLAEAALGFLWKSFRVFLGTDLESLSLFHLASRS